MSRFSAPTSSTDPNGNVTAYTYNNLGEQTSVSVPAQPLAQTPITPPVETGPQSGTSTYNYQATGLAPGMYEVLVTWTASPDLSYYAAYGLTGSGLYLGGYDVDQQQSPDPTGLNGGWYSLGDYLVTGSELDMSLSSGDGAPTYVGAWELIRVSAVATVSAYNGYGQVISTTDPQGNVTTYTYNALGEKTFELDPNPNNGGWTPEETWTYNADGQMLTSTVTPNYGGEVDTTFYTYNHLGEQTSATAPQAASIIDDSSKPGFNLTASDQEQETSGYDGESVLFGNGTATWTFSDLAAGEYEVFATWQPFSDASASAQYSVSDGVNTLAEVVIDQTQTPNGALQGGWQELGGQFEIESGNLVVQLPSIAGQFVEADAIQIVRLSGIVTTYTYDALGRQTSETDADGNMTTLVYDNLGRLMTETSPTGGVTSYTYDAAGQMLTETDPDGRVSVFGYDQLGREISENDYSSQAEYDNDPGDPDETLTWTYNAAGQLASESDQIFYGSGSSSTISYTYDAFGRVASETQASSGAPTVEFDYTYDANGNVLTETDTAAGALVETTTYSGYNGLNLPAMVVVATTAATLTIDYQYSSVGQTEQMTRYQDGELVDTTTYTYDGDGNLSEEKVVGPSGSTLEDFQYVYNGEGEIVTAITPTQGYVEYTYDAAGQLTSATYPNTPWANESYTYDAAGNRTSTTTGSTIDDTQQTAASTTTTGNELTSDGTFVYEYDADGNLIYQARISQAYSADDQTFYSYNNLGELVDVCTEDNGDTITQMVTYSYNAAGQRVSESVTVGQNTTATDFVYDLSGNAVLSFDGNQNLTGQYVYGQAVDQLLAQEDGSGNVSWMITDRDQSVRDVLQSSGGTTSVIDHIDYNSFGETITETAPSTPHLTGYAGYVNDLAIGMLETDSRVYDASIGRFISQDPSGFAGSANGNLYEYTSNSPLSNVDPSGLILKQANAGWLSGPFSPALAGAAATAATGRRGIELRVVIEHGRWLSGVGRGGGPEHPDSGFSACRSAA